MASKPEPNPSDTLYTPGMLIPESGVYSAIHHPPHRPTHPVVMRKGDKFPQCTKCDRTGFLAIFVARAIFEDEDFRPAP